MYSGFGLVVAAVAMHADPEPQAAEATRCDYSADGDGNSPSYTMPNHRPEVLNWLAA